MYPFICLSTDENHGHWHQTNQRVRCCPVRPFGPAMISSVHPFYHLAQTKFRLGSKKQWLASNRQTNKILHRCQMLGAILLLLPVDATTKEYNTVSTNTTVIHKQPPPPCTRTFCIFLKCGCTPHSTNFCIPLPLISGTKNCAISVKKVATKKEQQQKHQCRVPFPINFQTNKQPPPPPHHN